MSNRPDYSVVFGPYGVDIDRAIQMNGGPAATTFHDKAVALGNEANAAIDASVPPPPPPPPPPTNKTMMGSSKGAWPNVAAMVQATGLKPGNVIRAFNHADASAAPAGVSVCFSDDGALGRGYALAGATPGSTGYNQWVSALAVLRDDAPHWALAGHEEDIHGGGDYARLTQVYTGLNLVLAAVNKGRTHPIRSVSITTGMPFDTAAYKNWDVGADVIGMDNYSRKHWDTMIAWAKTRGKPWAVGETGIQAGTPATALSDDAILAAMVADHALYSGKALFVCYWPNSHQAIATNRPKSLAQLKAYLAA